jgi:predicted MFS family arabinose efflux permease
MSLVYAITQAPTKGWTSAETLGFGVAAVLLLAFFVWNESRNKHALMPLSIFRVGNVAAANAAQLPMIAAMFSMFFFISLYVQQVLGYSPVKTGLCFLPVPFVIGIVASNMSRVVGKVGYRLPMIIGPLFAAVGLFYMSHLQVGGNYWTNVFPGLIIMGIGMGQIFISVTIAATSGVPHHESGLASGLLNTSQQIGGALGLAILTGVATAAAKSFVSANPPHAASAAADLAVHAQVHGYHQALLVASVFPLITAFIAWRFVRHFETDADGAVIPA